MLSDREDAFFPTGSILYGGLAVILIALFVAVLLGVLTVFGWTGTVTWPNNSLFLLALYGVIVIASILAGWRSRQKGWAVGIGVGVVGSLFFLILASIIHEPIIIGIFLVKTLISCFIGAFGGIIGVNLSGNKG